MLGRKYPHSVEFFVPLSRTLVSKMIFHEHPVMRQVRITLVYQVICKNEYGLIGYANLLQDMAE